MAPTEIDDIYKTYNGFNSVSVIEPPCINFQKKGVPCIESATAGPPGSNSETFSNGISLKPTIDSQTLPEDYGAASEREEYLYWKLLFMNPQPLVPPIVFNNEITPPAPGPILEDSFTQNATPLEWLQSDKIDREDLKLSSPIQRKIMKSTSLSPVQVNTTTNEAISPPNHLNHHLDFQPGHSHLPPP
ncbi:hypothetical protein O181_033324 [Austropuccinia psidii MF-1]|uniref:Uncharacterized protein n=1 Tax=Austropuccinia psidii MF-1 TaxID=1389203 RepID=A0A9Q3CZ16_9BASI|nr:hypothetical protein [Austropuccinia psidii MF-1]